MDLTVLLLLSMGLCLDWVILAQMNVLPRPAFWAVPSPVVVQGAELSLLCQGQLGSERFQLWKDGELREERNTSRHLAEFSLLNVEGLRDARSYSCRYGQGALWSELSEPLAVVLTGVFPEPAISISPHSTISPGMTATIWCRISQRAPDQDVVFALLEAESLEPLQRQSLAETSADFVLPSARAQEAGSYRCIYYTKKAPYRGSHLSRAQELTVLGQLPKPTLCAQPGLVASAGTKITFWCSRPKLSSLGKVTFTLWKNRTQKPLQQRVSAEPWTSFLVPLVRPKHTGSYSCTYRENVPSSRDSEPSDLLELVVPGSLPKPSLSALPSLVVEPGTHVTLQCRQPPKSPLWGVTFTLLKAGTPQPLQSQSPSGTSAVFPLLSVRAQDAGNYSCIYSSRTVPYQVSKPSEVLEIWVTDALPKPSLSAWPAPEVVSGASVTLVCQGATWKTRYVLHKERGEEILPSMDIAQEGAHFFLTRVTPKHSGNYSCSYQVSTNHSLWTKLSDPLELIVRASVPSNTLIITLSCISLLFCAFLLTFLCCRSIPMGASLGNGPRRCPRERCLPQGLCPPHCLETCREEALYTDRSKETPKEQSVPKQENPQDVTYTQLKLKTLRKKPRDTKKALPEPTVYATVALN